MTRQVRLDPHGDNMPPDGWTVVVDPVGLIEHAIDEGPLFVRGDVLCRWAEDYGYGHDWTLSWLHSPTQELVMLCPDLSESEAAEVIFALSHRDKPPELDRPLRLPQVLETLYDEPDLWAKEPSSEHAFHWLEWLATRGSEDAGLKLALGLASTWESADDASLRWPYTAQSATQAWCFLKEWLGVSKPVQNWPPYPDSGLNQLLIRRLEEDLRSEAIKSDTEFFAELVECAPKLDILRLASRICAQVLAANPSKLSAERLHRLEPYISYDTVQELRGSLPVAEPNLPDWTFHAIHGWFVDRYLPFRLRAVRPAESPAQDDWVDKHGNEFAHCFLTYYAAQRAGGRDAEHLAWIKSSRLRDNSKDCLSLLVVLDGLAYPDAQKLVLHLGQEAPRLDLDVFDLALAPLPTVTEFAKAAVARGLLPANAQNEATGQLFSSGEDVNSALRQTTLGGVVVWTLNEPDHTYHFPESRVPSDIRRDVDTRLIGLAKRIADIVSGVADDKPLRVIITTDHGRLLKSVQRIRPVPPDMTAHGRSAWGNSPVPLGEEGFCIEKGLAYLHPGRFGLPDGQVYCIIISDEAFVTSDDRGGLELYPHGGLLPEEVLVPWIEYTRDRKPPILQGVLKGIGESSKRGIAHLAVRNLGSVDVKIVSLVLTNPNESVHIDCTVAHLNEVTVTVELSNWPSSQQLESLDAVLICQLPSGGLFRTRCEMQLQTVSLYDRSDIFDALGGI